MESIIKNIIVILVILTLAFAGYYLFISKDNEVLNFSEGSVNEQLFAGVQKYANRREVISKISLNTSIFSDERFNSLRPYTTPEKTYPVSRQNPFDDVKFLGSSNSQ